MPEQPIDLGLEERKLALEERKLENDNQLRKLEIDLRAREIDLGLEERKLALEERKFENDNQLRRQELDLKQRESGWFSRLASPLTTTIIGGVLALILSIAGTYFQGRQTLELEREKFGFSKEQESQKQRQTLELEREKFSFSKEQETQRQQHELILKMISVGDVKQARSNLEFAAETGLIADKALAARILKAKAIPVLPVPLGSSTDRIDQCDTARGGASRNGVVEIDGSTLFVESCVFLVPGGAGGFYRYVYRMENRGTKSLTRIEWRGVGIFRAELPPNQTLSSSHTGVAPPRIAETEIFLGIKSAAKFEAFVPSATSP